MALQLPGGCEHFEAIELSPGCWACPSCGDVLVGDLCPHEFSRSPRARGLVCRLCGLRIGIGTIELGPELLDEVIEDPDDRPYTWDLPGE